MPAIHLHWPNKERVLFAPPPKRGGKPVFYGDPGTPLWPDSRPLVRESVHGEPEAEPNRIIEGDNLLALQALQDIGWHGRFRCVYLDPPFNTKQRFSHYGDSLPDVVWLHLLRDRLEALRPLLHPEQGSVWLHLDQKRIAQGCLLCDEVFGASNFVGLVVWQKKASPQNDARHLSDDTDFLAVYACRRAVWRRNLLERTAAMDSRYTNPDNDARGPWKASGLSAKTLSLRNVYPVIAPSGNVAWPPRGTSWRVSEGRYAALLREGCILFAPGGRTPLRKTFLREVQAGRVPTTLWPRSEVGDSWEARREGKALFPAGEMFATPKPERLLERIVSIATDAGDWFLEGYGGSGTGAAVAYRMDRRFVSIEQGEQARTHILPRLEKVRRGETPYRAVAAGGFVFERVGPLVSEEDE